MKKPDIDIALVFDLGGTKLDSAVISSNGELVTKIERSLVPFSNNGLDFDKLFNTIYEKYFQTKTQFGEISGIGISVCGLVNNKTGVIEVAPNLNLFNFPLKKSFEDRFKIDIFISTDTRLATLGEAKWGAGVGYDNFAWVTLGTGFGGYFFLNGNLYGGERGFAGGFGHNTVDDINSYPCGCGRFGCLETFASGRALERNAKVALEMGHKTIIEEIAQGDKIRAEMIFQAEKLGDPLAKKLINQLIHYTSIGIGQIINFLDINLIIIGGGLTKSGGNFLSRIQEEVKNHIFYQDAWKDIKIVPESLPNATLYGAALDVFEKTRYEFK